MTILEVLAESATRTVPYRYFRIPRDYRTFRIDQWGDIFFRIEGELYDKWKRAAASRYWLERVDFYWCDEQDNAIAGEGEPDE